MFAGLRFLTGFLALALACLHAPSVGAQDRPAPAAEFALGAFFFPDDGVVTERFVGGAVRFYVSPRVSLGPEFAVVDGRNHRHYMATGNVTYDFIAYNASGPPLVTPFVVTGVGIFRTSEEFGRIEPFNHTEGGFTAGGGVRGSAGRHFFFGAEARIGWELHIRANALIGVRFGG